jgi:hypothetical protein
MPQVGKSPTRKSYAILRQQGECSGVDTLTLSRSRYVEERNYGAALGAFAGAFRF